MSKRRLQRPYGERRYRKLFVIAVEGRKTEPQYFGIFNDQISIIRVKCLPSRHQSSAQQVLERMRTQIKKEGLRGNDEAWLVVDKDNNSDEKLKELCDWSNEKDNYGFALSNPNFEYWLLLHFEDGCDIASSQNCSDRLKKYIPGYDKGVDKRKFARTSIDEAIRRARQRDNPPCSDWPRIRGCTTVYRLVARILEPLDADS